MEKKALALLLFFFLVSSGCVSRFTSTGAVCDVPGSACNVTRISMGLDPPCCPGTECISNPPAAPTRCHYTLASYWGSWQSAAMAAVIISALLAGLAYMLSYLLSNQVLLAWAKNEFLQVMVSAFIIGNVIGLTFATQQAMAQDITNAGVFCDSGLISPSGVPVCHMALANRYLQVMFDDAAVMGESIVNVNSVFMLLSNLGITVELFSHPWFGKSMTPAVALSIPSESMSTTLDALVKIMMLLKVQQILLNYITAAFFPILIVMGIVLRTFFFTRRLGGLLIAVALGLYLIYPLTYVLAHNVWMHTIKTHMNSYIVTSYLDTDIKEVMHPTGSQYVDVLLGLRERTGGIAEDLGRYVSGDFLIGDGGYIEKTAILLVYSTFIPFIALMITIGFVRGLSILLGGDVEIAGLTKIL